MGELYYLNKTISKVKNRKFIFLWKERNIQT